MDTELAYLVSQRDSVWKDQALCNGMTQVFFGPAAERPERRVEREALAKSFCRACPSQLPCRSAGRLNREHGIWGGENDEERATAGFAPRSPSRRSVIQARDHAPQLDDAAEDSFDSSLRELIEDAPSVL